jgi:hypothetical protein
VISIVHEIKRHIGDTKLSVVSPSDIAEAERRLGFPLPELLRELYTSVGDGGFGPPDCARHSLIRAQDERTISANGCTDHR